MNFSSIPRLRRQSFITRLESSVSYIVKCEEYPSLSEYLLRIRTQALWKVLAQISLPSSPSIFTRRSLSSAAALFVNVMASICHGFGASTVSMGLTRSYRELSPFRYDDKISSGSSSKPVFTLSELYASPYSIRYAIRLTITVVFPLPAPARISSGPFTAVTAWNCILLSPENLFSIIFFLSSESFLLSIYPLSVTRVYFSRQG